MAEQPDFGDRHPDLALVERLLNALDIPCDATRLREAGERVGPAPSQGAPIQWLRQVLIAANVKEVALVLLPWQRFDPRRLPVLLRHKGAWYFASDAAARRCAPDGRRTASSPRLRARNSTAPKCSGSGTNARARRRRRDDAIGQPGDPTGVEGAVPGTRVAVENRRGDLPGQPDRRCHFAVRHAGLRSRRADDGLRDADHARRRHGDRRGRSTGRSRRSARASSTAFRAPSISGCRSRSSSTCCTFNWTRNRARLGTLAAQVGSLEAVRQFFSATVVFALVDLPFALMFLDLHRHHRRRRRMGLRAAAAGRAATGLRHAMAAAGLVARPALAQQRASGSAGRQHPRRRVHPRQQRRLALRRGSGTRSPPASSATRSSSAPSAVSPRSRPAVCRRSRTSAAVVVGVWQIEAGLLTMGGLIACSILGGRIIAPVAQSVQYLEKWQHVSQSLNMVHQVLALQPERRADQQLLLPDEEPTAIALGGRPLCVRGVAHPATHRRRVAARSPGIGCCSWVQWARANPRC